MKQRKLYYRHKGKGFVIESKENGKSIHVWALPDPETLIKDIIAKSSYLSQEKLQNILEKIQRSDYKENKEANLH